MQACTQCRHPYSPTMKQQPSEAFTPQQQEGCEQEHKEEEGGGTAGSKYNSNRKRTKQETSRF